MFAIYPYLFIKNNWSLKKGRHHHECTQLPNSGEGTKGVALDSQDLHAPDSLSAGPTETLTRPGRPHPFFSQ